MPYYSSNKMRKKEKGFRARVILPLFIVFILITSMAGFMWGGSTTKIEYNGFKLVRLETGSFMLSIEGQRIAFNYFPSELEWINASEGIAGLFTTPMAYSTSDPESEYAEPIAQMQFNLGQLLEEIKGVYVQTSFISENVYSLPVITCRNATLFVPVIMMKASNSTEITLEQSCVTVSGRNRQELFMAYERLLYTIFGVMG